MYVWCVGLATEIVVAFFAGCFAMLIIVGFIAVVRKRTRYPIVLLLKLKQHTT